MTASFAGKRGPDTTSYTVKEIVSRFINVFCWAFRARLDSLQVLFGHGLASSS